MSKILSMNYQFEQIEGSDEQIEKLFQLLNERVHFISHIDNPDYKSHVKFVKNHPYLNWFMVKQNNDVLGTFYIKKDNSIGMNFKTVSNEIVAACIEFIKNQYSPQPALASMVPDYFYINIASSNKELLDLMNSLGKSQLQISFKI